MSEAKEFKNDNMTVLVMEEPGCLIKLDISVSPTATKAAFSKAVKSINKEVSLPGFRKGRAPDDLVLTHYKKYVEDEWRDIVLNTAFSEALDLIQKYPFNKNTTKQPHIKSVSKEEGAKFTIEFETAPTVPELVAENFTIPSIAKKEVSEADVKDFIEQMRLRMAEWNDVEGRGIEEGDYVDLDIVSLDEPGLEICKDGRFKVSKKDMAKWMHKLLMGLTVGNSVEGLSEKDHKEESCSSCGTEGHEHHHHHHDDEFKPTNCRITLKAIKKPTLPELNEEFAKRTSSESIEQLHENARKRLESDAENEKNDKIKESLKKQIEENYTFEVPKSFVSSSRPEEVAQLRLFFLTSEFAKKHGIQVSNNEIYQAAMHEVMTQGELAEDLLNGDERRVDSARTILYTNMLIEKVLNKLLQLATENASK